MLTGTNGSIVLECFFANSTEKFENWKKILSSSSAYWHKLALFDIKILISSDVHLLFEFITTFYCQNYNKICKKL